MSTEDLVEYKLHGMEPQAKQGDLGGVEGICNSCLEERFSSGESWDDIIYEFCG
jgi:hypothetical protein